jgi:predicted RNA-binding protein YlqC (UPF0109 family)
MAAGGIEDLLVHLARSLVGNPDAVRVDRVERDGEVVLELHVAEDDLGKVIGRGGRIARSLRVLVRASGAKAGERRLLEIVG